MNVKILKLPLRVYLTIYTGFGIIENMNQADLRFAILAADTVLFTLRDNELYVRLIKVNRPPQYVNVLGLPGGLLSPVETADEASLRHLEAKGGIDTKRVYSEQLYTFSDVERDSRGRVVAVAYLALVPWNALSSAEQLDTKDVVWKRVGSSKKLAYDHGDILALGVKRLQSRITYTTLISKLMPKEFTLTELEKAYESVLGTQLDKRNFRKKILKLEVLKELPEKRSGGRFRPAQLYSFASKKVVEIEVI